MIRFALRRTASMIAILFAISVSTFLIFQVIPNGDPALRLAGRTATPANIEAVRRTWGFDKPIYVQYVKTMEQIFNGTVISYSQQVNVVDQIRRGLPVTISLALGAAIIWLAIGVVFGVLSAVQAGRWLDRALTVLAMIGISTPVFFLGAVMSYFIGFKLGLLPTGDYVPLTVDPVGWFTHLLMPWLAIAFLSVGYYSRVLRANILDTINEDFVRAARAKGLSNRQVLIRHTLRNSLIPIVSLWGLDFAALLGGGAILTETVFNLHGVGQYAAQSVQALDIPPVLVVTMYGAFAVVLIGAVIDIVYAVLDPRLRMA